VRYLLLAICTFAGLSAPLAWSQVSYAGNVLAVDGQEFKPLSEPAGSFAPGQVIVIAREGKEDEVASELGRLSLHAKRQGVALVLFLVQVPVGFERQWAEALRKLPSAEAASTNDYMYPSGAK
jgi:hypothetical protein